MTHEARWSGTCEACGERYGPGTPIRADGEQSGMTFWSHATCPTTYDDTRPACATCWLIGPCDCEDET